MLPFQLTCFCRGSSKVELKMDDTGSTQSRDIDYVEQEFEKALDLHNTGKFDQAARHIKTF